MKGIIKYSNRNKNSLKELNIRLKLAEERINTLDNRSRESIQGKEQRKRKVKKDSEIWDINANRYIYIMGISEGEERENEEQILKEVMAKNFPNLLENNLYIQEA